MSRDFTIDHELNGFELIISTEFENDLVHITVIAPGDVALSVSLPPRYRENSSAASSASSSAVTELSEIVADSQPSPIAVTGDFPSGLHLATVPSRDPTPVLLNGTQRVLSAFTAGRHAKATIEGCALQAAPRRPNLAPNYFVVLRDKTGWQYSPAWVARRRLEVWHSVAEGGHIHRSSVWHGFPSEAEARAYVLGAEFQWPPH